VRLLGNPVLLRAAVVFCCAALAFLLGMIVMRLLRKSITEEAELSSDAHPSLEVLPLHLYNTVIQQLKQQKHELVVQSQAEQQRARATETFSQAVLTNLSCGVLVFSGNGLVKTTNPAAKDILGFAATTGMGAEDIFRGAVVENRGNSVTGTFPDGSTEEPTRLADEVLAVLREGSGRRQLQAAYETPANQKRFIAVTISPVRGSDGGLFGVACLINDLSELEGIRRQEALRSEMSAAMALQLRTSLKAIIGYAQQLADSNDASAATKLTEDIAQEAADLDRTLGGFLTEKRSEQNLTAGAASAN
jgi:PAS domain-containing protein